MDNHLDIKEDEYVLFFMGYLYNFSGLLEVIELLNTNDKKYSKFKLLIVGKGEQESRIKEIISVNNLNEKVILLEWQPYEKIPELIAIADIYLLPAYNNDIMRDIVPIKKYEYLSLSKPVVSTKLAGVMTEFKKGNGVVYAENSREVLNVCHSLVQNNLVEKTGKLGLEFVKKNCNWEVLVNRFIDLLNKHSS